jgi:hypothetical protein
MRRFCVFFNFNLDRASSFLLRVLIGIDLLLIFAHILVLFNNPAVFLDSIWCLEQDGGVGEIFQYAKELWVVLLFTLLAVRRFQLNHLTWAVLFAYLFVDDAFQLHEKAGELVARASASETIAGMRAEDVGELSVYIVFGLLAVLLIRATLLRSSGETKTICLRFLFIMVLLFTTAVIADLLHSHIVNICAALGIPYGFDIALYYGLGIVEDGGELVVMSLAGTYAFDVYRKAMTGFK